MPGSTGQIWQLPLRYDSRRFGRESEPVRSGESDMQSAQPRDLGALALVVGLFLILFIVTLTLGSPLR